MGMLQTWVASTLLVILGDFVRGHRLGKVVSETLFLLDKTADLKRRPDLAFVSRERWPRGPRPTAEWDVVPDLAVEVISPTNTAKEVLDKIGEYFATGVRRVWVAYCEQQLVYVYRSPKAIQVLGHEDALDGEDVIPGFRLPLATLFEDLVEDDVEESKVLRV
jgi:Uma2 family endonuclease